MASNCAPIALFAYRRPEHLKSCLISLLQNPEASSTALWIFCDGPRSAAEADATQKVRELARATGGFSSVTVIERPENIGLAASVISGVAEVLDSADRVIVVEDDLVVSPDFLGYMNQGLDLYADVPEVVSIHAFTYALDAKLPQSFFLRGADCWGWATWRRGWAVFNPDGQALLTELDSRGQGLTFDFDGAYPYRQMLVDQVAGKVDSWAIRWNASAFLANKLTLYPGNSLVENIGQDGSGTHSGISDSHRSTFGRMTLPLERIPVQESSDAREAFIRTLTRSHGSGLRSRMRRILTRNQA
jgi:hypothetical protein